jgi:hypothetical protein
MIKADTILANPSKTTQLKLMLMFAAEGFEDVVADVVLPVLLPVVLLPVLLVLLPVLDGEVELLESATGKTLV